MACLRQSGIVPVNKDSLTISEIQSIKKSIFWTNMEVGKGSRVQDFTGDDNTMLRTSSVVKEWKWVSCEPLKETSLKVWHVSDEKAVLILFILDVKNSINKLGKVFKGTLSGRMEDFFLLQKLETSP